MKNIITFDAKSKRVLGVIAIISLLALLAVENSKIDVKKKWYDQKLEASTLAKKAEDFLKDYRMKKGIFIDAINDPNETGLIGQDITIITTDRGYIDSKLTSLNPNFAAVLVDMLKEADVKTNDVVAVSFTGSFPALNISVLSALQILKLKPIIITSVGSSNWGANDPAFTWLDMERVLFNAGIFGFKSVAASVGGGLDKGRGLSPEGRKLLDSAIIRNKVELIEEEFLEKSIEKRLEIYRKNRKNNPIKVYINVGGGIASLGSAENAQFIPGGLSTMLELKNYPVKGVLIKMAENKIPIIHLLNINQIANKYGLPVSPVPLPEPGKGEVFVQKQYNVTLTIFVTVILIGLILAIFFIEKKKHQLGSEPVIAQANDLSNHEL